MASHIVSGKLAQWDEFTANGRNWAQATAGLRAVITAGDCNGHDVVTFTGGGFMSMAGFVAPATPYVWAIYKYTNRDNFSCLLHNDYNGSCWCEFGTANTPSVDCATSVDFNATASGGYHMMRFKYNRAAGTCAMAKDNGSYVTTTGLTFLAGPGNWDTLAGYAGSPNITLSIADLGIHTAPLAGADETTLVSYGGSYTGLW